MDSCFLGDEFDKLTVLMVIERYTKLKKAVGCGPKQGVDGELCCQDGHRAHQRVLGQGPGRHLKTDQAAIKFLVDDVCESDRSSYHQRVCTAGSNGIVERTVQSVEQCLRTLKSSLDERMGVKIDVLHPVLTWLCGVRGLHDESHGGSVRRQEPVRACEGKKVGGHGLGVMREGAYGNITQVRGWRSSTRGGAMACSWE